MKNALSIVESEYAASQSGQLSVEAAQADAQHALAAMRYGDGDYFWINDMQPRMIMHPLKPEMNGRDLSDYKDPTGKKLFVEMAQVAQASGSGFVSYEWPKPGKDAPQPKLSYVAEFKPWGWVIGTGVYVDDLNELFFTQLKTEGALTPRGHRRLRGRVVRHGKEARAADRVDERGDGATRRRAS